jgi:hypothetical protein
MAWGALKDLDLVIVGSMRTSIFAIRWMWRPCECVERDSDFPADFARAFANGPALIELRLGSNQLTPDFAI